MRGRAEPKSHNPTLYISSSPWARCAQVELFWSVFVCRLYIRPSTIVKKPSLKLLGQIQWNNTGSFFVWPSTIIQRGVMIEQQQQQQQNVHFLFCYRQISIIELVNTLQHRFITRCLLNLKQHLDIHETFFLSIISHICPCMTGLPNYL